jgi:hypothetical protein
VPVPFAMSKYQEAYRPSEHVALMPADKFLEAFNGNCHVMADFLSKKSQELAQQWQQENKGASMAYQRTAVEKLFSLFSHSWKSSRFREEQSEYQLQLNTFKYDESD